MSPTRLGRLALGALAWLLAGQAFASLALSVQPQGLDADEAIRAQQLRDTATALLADAGSIALPPLQLRFDDHLPHDVHGRLHGRQIRLARHLLASPDRQAPALAALIHELGHAIDRQLGLSRDARLLDLAGWQLRPRRLGLRTARNAMRDRSPDPYERHSPAEFVAVNLEYFFLDPDYACRRPALHAYLHARLGTPGASAGHVCPPDVPLLVPGSDTLLDSIDPRRVQAVEYLLAEPSDALMSRWGHSMLRLVICAPERGPDEDCRLDLEYHLVLSFRAFVDDVQISSWRGLTGRYPARLYILPMTQVIEEYTQLELRDLRSVPLRLSPTERQALLEHAAQRHWTYDGRYTFLGNNCASELFKLLREGVPRLAQAPIAAITPTGLLRRLTRAGIADPAPLQSADAERQGYRFVAADTHIAQMFTTADQALGLPAPDAAHWLALPAHARTPWLAHGDLRASAALLVLEELALRRAQQQAMDHLKRAWRSRGRDTDIAHAQLMALEATLARPAALLDGSPGYGLPQAHERAHIRAQASQLSEDRQARIRLLEHAATATLPDTLRDDLAISQRNLAQLAAHLRQLAAPAPATLQH